MSKKFTYILVAFIVLPFLPLTLAASSAPERELLDAQIKQWVSKLGDDSYVVRKQAEEHLLRIGSAAMPELRNAETSEDPEVAARAKSLISRFGSFIVKKENSNRVSYWIKQYDSEKEELAKAGVIWILSGPFYDAPDGEGLATLMRILQYDSNRSMQAEAVKVLIGLPPTGRTALKKWYKTIDNDLKAAKIQDKDELLSLAAQYAQVWNELQIPYEKGQKPDAALVQNVRKVSDAIAAFQKNPANDKFQPGNFIDILVYYAKAEILDLAGLTSESEQAVKEALALRTKPLGDNHPLNTVNENIKQPFYDHFDVGRILRFRYRLKWAKQELQLAEENTPLLQKLSVLSSLAEVEQFLYEHAEAVKYYDKALEIVNSNDYKNSRGDSHQCSVKIRVGKILSESQLAADAKDWTKVQELTQEGLQLDPFELDLLIFSHKVIENKAVGLNANFVNIINNRNASAVFQLESNMRSQAQLMNNQPEARRAAAIEVCNQVAWLFAGTNGNYSEAKALIDAAVNADPDNVSYLDTLAHVYFLGKDYKKAVETQEKVVRFAPEAVVFRQALEKFKQEPQELLNIKSPNK
jgi:hypothetical protein